MAPSSNPEGPNRLAGLADYESFDAMGLAALVRSKAVTPGELLEAAVSRIDAQDAGLNAIVHRFEDRGRQAIAEGLPDGPFTGVPFLLKNTGLEMAGTPLTTGSRLFETVVSVADSTLTSRYKSAGLVVIGKTNTPEFAMSFTTEPQAFGPTRNPWDESRSAGGSSGGATAAVAAGYVPMAHTSDGAGSTRVPASHCGLFGFKPSRMRNPLGPVMVEAIGGMSAPHAASWSVRDNAALLDATAGPDVGDPYACPPRDGTFLSEVTMAPGRLRIGLTLASPLDTPVDPAARATAIEAARLCETLGHHVEETTAAYDAEALKRAWRLIVGVAILPAVDGQAQRRGLADPLSMIEPVNAAWVAEARLVSGAQYGAAIATLHQCARALGRFFQRFDVLLSPTVAEPPPVLGRMAGIDVALDDFYDMFWRHAPFTCVFNAAGCPAMSVPLGQTPTGLPMGAHFGAGFGRDGLLYRLAGQLEAARPWFGRRPPRSGVAGVPG